MSEDIKFLKEFQAELKAENRNSQAPPHYWVLQDFKRVLKPSGYGEGELILFKNVEYVDPSDLAQAILAEAIELQNLNEDEMEELTDYMIENLIDMSGVYDLMDSLNSTYGMELFDYTDEYFFVPNLMFFTRQEALEHLQLNKSLYSEHVHPYSMTEWRTPKVERVLKILMEYNWDAE